MSRELTGEALVAAARALASAAHHGQTDKVGRPYIGHPADVAARVDGPVAEAVAWLHDVVEDTPVTCEALRDAGFPEAVVDAVDALTKRPGETLESAIARAAADPVARHVKRADVASNTDPSRTALLDPAARQRLAAKYARILEILDRHAGAQ